jgi:Flp pilus assembly protein TadD
LQLPRWLQAWGGGTLIFATVGALFLCFVVVMWWDASSNQIDNVAHPAPGAAVSRSSAGSPAPAASAAVPQGMYEPIAALDLTRSGADQSGGDAEAVRARYEQALQTNPDDHEALNDLGQALAGSGRWDDAVARFSRAIELSPDKAAYHFNLAHTLGQQKKWDAAANQYRLALGLSPGDYPSQFNLAVALHRKGDDSAAVGEFEKAIEMAPSEALFHVALATSLERVGRTSDAQREFRKYLEMEPAGIEAARVKSHLEAMDSAPPPAPGGAPSSSTVTTR